ncbi:hypothetical protein ED733_005622 [Metarhizium rileyi]|uniref:Uncharacterized protein n=1 Tax=Metarhizium rileyi (strain RCEF 4871) TaxID=1649241 RepID=A0A5C6GDK0_METRR|nr:hypothetical protein ED733_005622 [Metarhizium rileyi]
MRNEKKYHYKLHSLDIYFWTQQDALLFINGVRRVLPSVQVEILDEPGLPQSTEMSSVVQRLENVAVSDPLYGAAASPPSTTASQEPTVGVPLAASPDTPVNAALPPPPPPPAKFVPMVYNPAAPAAPELIRHREKTPPPDEDPLNPLAVAVAHDYQKQPFTPGLPPQSQLPPGVSSPGLPLYTSNISSFQSQFAGPPKHPAVQRAVTMPANASLVSPGFPVSPGLIPTPPSQPSATVPGQPGGFSDHTHHHQGSVQKDGQDYSIHQQLYRPTEGEYGKKNRPHQYQPKQETRGRLEENAGRLERGVSGMLKKFEKKFG